MPRLIKLALVSAVLAIASATVPSLRGQNRKESLPAPVPTQVFTARRVFVSNAGGDTLGDYSGGPDRVYNQLYTALKGWGRYELVGVPAEAEMVFEISFAAPTVAESVSGGTRITPVSSRPLKDPQFRLAILDLKTHVLLWTFTEHVQPALLQANRDKNFDQAMAAIVNDIKNVAGQPAPLAGSK
jgi:hypothetical protein